MTTNPSAGSSPGSAPGASPGSSADSATSADSSGPAVPSPAGKPGELLVNIDVDDLTRAEAFYTAALGLVPGRRFGAGALELLGLAVPIYLLVKPPASRPFVDAGTTAGAGAGVAAGRDYHRHWTPVHLDVAVEDLEAAVHRAEAAGARREREISDHAWGRMALMSDPFGHGFCLLQWKGRGYDEIATGSGPAAPGAGRP